MGISAIQPKRPPGRFCRFALEPRHYFGGQDKLSHAIPMAMRVVSPYGPVSRRFLITLGVIVGSYRSSRGCQDSSVKRTGRHSQRTMSGVFARQ
jgi:hypothetical protein